jgi:hypothetical protein
MLVLDLGRKERIDHLLFTPDGRGLAAWGDFGVRLWREIRAGAGAQVVTDQRVEHARFAEDGKSLFCSESDLWRVDVSTGTTVNVDNLAPYPRFDVSPDGRFLIAEAAPGDTYTSALTCRPTDNLTAGGILWEQVLPPVHHHVKRNYPHYLADGTRFVRLGGGWIVEHQRFEFHAVVYDATTGQLVARSPMFGESPDSTFAAPDGRWLVGLRRTWSFYWPIEAGIGSEGHLKSDRRKHFTDAAFHPSGKYLAVTSNDRTVKLHDTTTWELERTFSWKIGQMQSVAFSPDGTLAAAGNDRGQVVVWDVDL